MAGLLTRGPGGRRRIITSICAAALALASPVLTGCSTPSESQHSAGAHASVDLTTVSLAGDPGSKPTITLATPFSVGQLQRKVITEGKGTAAALGQRVTIQYVGVNGTDGKEFATSYGDKPLTFVLEEKNNIPGLVEGLVGATPGTRILLAIPPDKGYGLKGLPGAGIGPTDTLVLAVDLQSVGAVLSRATGTAVAPKAGLPTVSLAANGAPKIILPKGNPPTALAVQPLIVGKGARVQKGQQITVQYTGVLWPGGTVFDSSWQKHEAATFEIGNGRVISGWDRGLVGQTVGSQILLVIPPDDGYGAAGRPQSGIKGTDTLVFVVDILDAV